MALRTGVHRPTLAGVAAATLIYQILRRSLLARLTRRGHEVVFAVRDQTRGFPASPRASAGARRGWRR